MVDLLHRPEGRGFSVCGWSSWVSAIRSGWVPGSFPRGVGVVRAAGLLPGLNGAPQAFTAAVTGVGPQVLGWMVLPSRGCGGLRA